MCHFPHLFNKINNVVVIGEVNGQTGDLQNPFIYCIFVWGLSLSLSGQGSTLSSGHPADQDYVMKSLM